MKKTSMNFVFAACITLCCYLFVQAFNLLSQTSHKDVVIIDKSLENYQELAVKSEKNSLVILVENTDNGFSLLEAKIKSLTGIERLHILTHGTNGSFILGYTDSVQRKRIVACGFIITLNVYTGFILP